MDPGRLSGGTQVQAHPRRFLLPQIAIRRYPCVLQMREKGVEGASDPRRRQSIASIPSSASSAIRARRWLTTSGDGGAKSTTSSTTRSGSVVR